MKRMGLVLAFAASTAIGCSTQDNTEVVGTSGDSSAAATATTGTVSSGDRDFVHDIGMAGLAEVEFGKLAVQRAGSPDVKKFGQMMVDDHTAAGQKLAAVASENAIEIPVALDEDHQELYKKLSALQGAMFDREYMSAMVKGHEDVVGTLETRIDKVSLNDWKAKIADALPGTSTKSPQPPTVVAESTDDPVRMAINQWAANAYPTTYEHLRSARGINEAVTHNSKSTQ